jgi:hypothetical protein
MCSIDWTIDVTSSIYSGKIAAALCLSPEGQSIMSNSKLDITPEHSFENKICLFCGKHILPNKGLGTGKISDGLFCDLDCYANYKLASGNSIKSIQISIGNQEHDN